MIQPNTPPKSPSNNPVPPPPPVRPTQTHGTHKVAPASKPKPVRHNPPRQRSPRRPHQGRRNPKAVHFGPSRSRNLPDIKQPPRNPDGMYLIPLGGLEEIGRNSAAVEYKNDIVVIDLGLMFPGEQMYGIDYVIPDISPLYGKEKKIKGVIITHAHYDHFGAVPHLLPKLGNPPIYGSEFTMRLVQKRQDDFPQYPSS